MERDTILQGTILKLSKLSDGKLIEATHFIDYLAESQKTLELAKGIQKLFEQSDVFKFVRDDEDIYTIADIKDEY